MGWRGMTSTFNDITAVFYTAQATPKRFAQTIMVHLEQALGDIPLVIINQDKSVQRHQAQIYRNVLEGAKRAATKYVALCEDDCLYHAEHFKFRPKDGHWGYNMNYWNIHTWGEPIFTQKPGGRRNLSQLICGRDLLITHLEERFRLHPDDDKIDIQVFGEPGKYDNQLGTTPHPSEYFYTNPPNIVFSHQANLQFKGLGTRKAVGQIRAIEIPIWGTAKKIRGYYD